MEDRELLMLAAKAAGIEGVMTQPFTGLHVSGRGDWNPLTDDGDALRLAVGLSFDLNINPKCVDVFNDDGYISESCDEHETLTATRRAIVMAAAEAGKNMP